MCQLFTCDSLLITVLQWSAASSNQLALCCRRVRLCVLKRPSANGHHCQRNDMTASDSTTTPQRNHLHHFLSCRCYYSVTKRRDVIKSLSVHFIQRLFINKIHNLHCKQMLFTYKLHPQNDVFCGKTVTWINSPVMLWMLTQSHLIFVSNQMEAVKN